MGRRYSPDSVIGWFVCIPPETLMTKISLAVPLSVSGAFWMLATLMTFRPPLPWIISALLMLPKVCVAGSEAA